MGADEELPQTFIERILTLLEERFPWLSSARDEPVGGADTVDELSDLYKSLIEQRDEASPPSSRTWCARNPSNSTKNFSSRLIPPFGFVSIFTIQLRTPSG